MSSREPITPDEAFEGLPSEIRKAIEASGWQEKIRRIAGAHKLRVDQGSALEDESLRFMAGLQSVEEYAVHLAQELALPDDEFRSFIAELEKDIFEPIQADIRAALQPNPGHLAVSSSVGAGEEDDLEALLNEGEDAIAKVAAAAPTKSETPKAPPTPAGASVPAAAPVATATAAPALAAAAQKLALPVSKPAEMIAANLQKPAAAPVVAPNAPAIPKSDPYREAV